MTTTATAHRETNSHHDWFARSGFPFVSEDRDCTVYVRRLVRYISDASTVRARTLDHFGYAPDLPTIRKLRQEWLDEIAYRTAALNTYGEWRALKRNKARAEKMQAAREVKLRIVPKEPPPLPVEQKAEPLPVAARGHMLRTATDVIDACADACGVSHGELIGTMRDRPIAKARNLCAAVLRARGNSLNITGRLLGKRDHTTIINAIHRFFTREMEQPEFAAAWASLAPCVMKAARTAEELNAMAGVRM